MFTKDRLRSPIDRAIDEATRDLLNYHSSTEEYATILERIVKLSKLKETDKSPSLSPDTLILAATNLLGIAMILRHEHLNVITSKAVGFVNKPR